MMPLREAWMETKRSLERFLSEFTRKRKLEECSLAKGGDIS